MQGTDVNERILYISKHRKRGDIACVARRLSLSINVVRDIVNGKYVGVNGKKVLQIIEKIIDKRLLEAQKIREKYSIKE